MSHENNHGKYSTPSEYDLIAISLCSNNPTDMFKVNVANGNPKPNSGSKYVEFKQIDPFGYFVSNTSIKSFPNCTSLRISFSFFIY